MALKGSSIFGGGSGGDDKRAKRTRRTEKPPSAAEKKESTWTPPASWQAGTDRIAQSRFRRNNGRTILQTGARNTQAPDNQGLVLACSNVCNNEQTYLVPPGGVGPPFSD